MFPRFYTNRYKQCCAGRVTVLTVKSPTVIDCDIFNQTRPNTTATLWGARGSRLYYVIRLSTYLKISAKKGDLPSAGKVA
jgi:hypothetical protein